MGERRPLARAGHSKALDRRWLSRQALAWFDRRGRDYPWRRQPDPFRVLVAELLLQRTRADLVLRVYEKFLARYPDAHALAAAQPTDVLESLRSLGFSHRTARMPVMARELAERHGGEVPASKEELLALTGVGDYVANAVLAVAYGERRPLLDPNVIRLLARVTGSSSVHARPRTDRALWEQAAALLPQRRAPEFSLALIDLGAVICRPRRPRCNSCPLRSRCAALSAQTVTPG